MVEAGLGGVTDATNVFEADRLACAVITAIDNDHMKALGEPQTCAVATKGHKPCLMASQFVHTCIATLHSTLKTPSKCAYV